MSSVLEQGFGILRTSIHSYFTYNHTAFWLQTHISIRDFRLKACSRTVVVGDDTDLLVLLIYHTKLIHNEIFFIPEPKKNSKCRIWNVKQVKTELGSFVCKHILFLHAMLGCDTSSWLFGIQSKCWASKGSWGLGFNSLNIKPNWTSWWKGAGGNECRKKQWVIKFPPS